MTKTTIAIALVALLGAAVAAYAAIAPPSVEPGEPLKASRPALVIKGHVNDLYPGVRTKLAARVRNRSPRPVRILGLKGKVRRASPECGRRYLRVRKARPKRLLAPGRGIRVRLRVRLASVAPDACMHARWPLRFRARARFERAKR